MPFGSEGVEPGIGLALSGGGFRATLFHIGSLWRLNELGYLPKLSRISSVSGGSITNAVLGLHWKNLNFQNNIVPDFLKKVVEPLREFCKLSVDTVAIGEGAFVPWKSISDSVRGQYEEHLLGKATLQDLPDAPRFVFNSTNFQTGNDFRFSKPYCGDYRLGLIPSPTFSLALAVTASSAFPPFLSPVVFKVDPASFQPVTGSDLNGKEEYCRMLYLTDGGVYDNLGLETVWKRYKTLLVSDAGAPLGLTEEVNTSWYSQALRALDITTNQARALRKRALLSSFLSKDEGEKKDGTYWGIETDIRKYGLINSLPCDPQKIHELANIRTRLNPFSEQEQCELINWGYAVCDAAMRRHVIAQGTPVPPPKWPSSQYKLG